MAHTYDFWTHGVNVVAELTREFTGHDNELHLRRSAFGAIAMQAADTDNRFHLALPTPSYLHDWDSLLHRIWLRVWIGASATIDHVSLHETTGADGRGRCVWHSVPLCLSGRWGEFGFDVPDKYVTGSLVLSVHVRFSPGEDHERQVTFTGAGMSFGKRRFPSAQARCVDKLLKWGAAQLGGRQSPS